MAFTALAVKATAMRDNADVRPYFQRDNSAATLAVGMKTLPGGFRSPLQPPREDKHLTGKPLPRRLPYDTA